GSVTGQGLVGMMPRWGFWDKSVSFAMMSPLGLRSRSAFVRFPAATVFSTKPALTGGPTQTGGGSDVTDPSLNSSWSVDPGWAWTYPERVMGGISPHGNRPAQPTLRPMGKRVWTHPPAPPIVKQKPWLAAGEA